MKLWTQLDIKDMIARGNRKVLFRMLWALYQRQTSEQNTNTTHYENGRGFNAFDAEPLSRIAKKAAQYGAVAPWKEQYIRNKLGRYVAQLTEIANQNEARKEVRRAETERESPAA